MSLNKLTNGAQTLYCNPSFGSVTLGPKSAVTQLTNINTGVTINSPIGAITTVSSPGIAAGITQAFTVTNSSVLSSSFVMLSLQFLGNSGSGTGVPVVSVSSIANGSFNVNVSNANGSTALNLGMVIYFMVV